MEWKVVEGAELEGKGVRHMFAIFLLCLDWTNKFTGKYCFERMSHTSKSKAKGVSTSSFFDLKAELSKQEAHFAKAKGSGKNTTIIGGVKRPDKVYLYYLQFAHY